MSLSLCFPYVTIQAENSFGLLCSSSNWDAHHQTQTNNSTIWSLLHLHCIPLAVVSTGLKTSFNHYYFFPYIFNTKERGAKNNNNNKRVQLELCNYNFLNQTYAGLEGSLHSSFTWSQRFLYMCRIGVLWKTTIMVRKSIQYVCYYVCLINIYFWPIQLTLSFNLINMSMKYFSVIFIVC